MRRPWLIVVPLALLLTISACANKSAPVPAAPTQSATSTVRVAYPEGRGYSTILNSLIAAYQESHPGQRVEKVPLTGDFKAEAANLAFNGQADLLLTYYFGPSTMFKPLDPYLQKSGVDEAPYGSVLDQMRVNAGLWEMPIGMQPSLLYYNPAVFAQYSVAEPTAGWTWDQFRQTARALTRGSGQQQMWGFETLYFENLAMAYVEERTGLPPWQAPPEVVGEALQFLAGLVFDDQSVPPGPEPYVNAYGDMSRVPSYNRFLEPLVNGHAAMAMEQGVSTERITLALSAATPVKVAPIPTFPGKTPVGVMTPLGMGILQKSKNPDAAWQFIQFASGEQGAAILAKEGVAPAYFSDAVAKAWAQRPNSLPAGAGLDSLPQTNWQVWGPAYQNDYSRWINLFTRAVTQTLSGTESWDQALKEYEKAIKEQHSYFG